jgi:hypothetical protein
VYGAGVCFVPNKHGDRIAVASGLIDKLIAIGFAKLAERKKASQNAGHPPNPPWPFPELFLGLFLARSHAGHLFLPAILFHQSLFSLLKPALEILSSPFARLVLRLEAANLFERGIGELDVDAPFPFDVSDLQDWRLLNGCLFHE